MRDVMRFMIFRNEVKPDVPVPRGELSKLFPTQVCDCCHAPFGFLETEHGLSCSSPDDRETDCKPWRPDDISADISSRLCTAPTVYVTFPTDAACGVGLMQRKNAAPMIIKLAQAKFPDALGMEMKEVKVASARAPAGE